MNVQQYCQLLHGKGQRHPAVPNLYYIPKAEKSIEERSVESICPPPQLNPEYMPNRKIQRSGKLPERRSAPQPPPQLQGIDPTILRRILGI
jgi:hypothetical protein